MGLLSGPLAPSLVEDLALLGSWMPFGRAAKNVGHFRKIEVSEATGRRVAEKSGQAYVEMQTEQAKRLEAEIREAPPGPGLQQLSVDGAMVPLLHGEWAEVKTLAIGTIDEPNLRGEVHARDLSYFSRMMEHQGFARLATVETHRRGTERAGEVCAVVDGAEWQQKFIDLHRPGAVRILDWCHAAEHLAKASQAAFGSGTAAASEWLGVQLHQLKHGEPEQTLRDLRALCRELGQGLGRELGQELDRELARKGVGGDGAEAAKAVRSSLEYLEKRKGQIRYAEFQAEGYPIGSGAVESANKLVVEGRLKGSGMHWAREHVNPMVALRTVVCGDRWEEVWPQISQRQRQKSGGQPAGRQTKPGDQERPAGKEASVAKTPPPVRKAAVPPPRNTRATHGPDDGPERRPSTAPHRTPAPNHPWRRMSIGRKSPHAKTSPPTPRENLTHTHGCSGTSQGVAGAQGGDSFGSGQGGRLARQIGGLTHGIGKLQSLRGEFYSGSSVKENERRCIMPPAAFPTGNEPFWGLGAGNRPRTLLTVGVNAIALFAL